MNRQEVINLIQKEVRREGKKLSGDIEAKLAVMRRDVRVCTDKVLLARDSLLEFKHTVSDELRQMQEK